MGSPMAVNLVEAGFSVRAWNRSSDRARPLAEQGADVFEDPAEAASGCDLLITMLSDAAAVLDTAAAALDSLSAGATWAQMSTIGIEGTQRCAELAERAGVDFVDAPVLGTREPAQQGKLVVLASGPDAALTNCLPVFDAVGARTLRLGPAGAGTKLKVVVNSWIVGVVAVLAETISLAEALEVDPASFLEAIKGGALDLPYAHLKGAAMIDKSFDDPAFRLALSLKDAELVLAAADHARLEVPVMQAVVERLQRAERAGHGDADMAATYLATAPRLGMDGDGDG